MDKSDPRSIAPPLLTGEGLPDEDSWNNQDAVQWTDHATDEIKTIFKKDMLLGVLSGAEAAVDDLAFVGCLEGFVELWQFLLLMRQPQLDHGQKQTVR